MAEWKKVVVSGSSAELAGLTLTTQLAVAQGGTGLNSLSGQAGKTLTVNGGANGFTFADASAPSGTISSSAQVVAALPSGTVSGSSQIQDASLTQKGIVELATTAEVTTGTDTVRAVTPDSLKDGYQGSANVATLGTVTAGDVSAILPSGTVSGSSQIQDASLTQKGIVELATTAEVTTGTDATRAVTPDSLKDGYQGSANVVTLGTVTAGDVSAILPSGTVSGSSQIDNASATQKGIVELATDLEVATGTDTTRAVTPANVASFTGTSNIVTVGTVITGDVSAILPSGTVSGSSQITIQDASTSQKGIVELATTAEVTTGTDTVRAITPDALNGSTLGLVGLTLSGDANIAGDLTVQGTASFQSTENLLVKDKFIMLASGSAAATDGGIVIEQANPSGGPTGAVFAYDGLSTGRWGIDTAFNPTGSSYTPQAFMSAVVIGADDTLPTGTYAKKGNIFIGDSADEVWIYGS
jgi:hypothetical protein